MLWLTTRTGAASHPLRGDGQGGYLASVVNAPCGQWGDLADGDKRTDAPLKRPCQHPACQALLRQAAPPAEGAGTEGALTIREDRDSITPL